MSDRITLSSMRFEGHHGVTDDERALPQPLEVDLEVEADLARAGRTDDVVDTIDAYKSDDTAWKAFGGWRLNPYLSFELAYVNLGSPDDEILPDTRLTVETDGIAPYVVGTLPIGDWFEVFAKAGYYWYDTEARLTTPLGTTSDKDSDETFTWSAGLGVNIFERMNVRLEYEQFDFNNADTSNALWLTGAFRF